MDVDVRLLGPPEVSVEGVWLPLRPTKPHALLALLAVRGVRVRREEAAALLWPDADAEHAHGDLRQALRSLSRGPFAGLLERDRGALWLTVGSDVAEFRRAVADRRWVEALGLHRGALLEAFEIDGAEEFASWLELERTALAEAWRRACRAASRDAVDAGRHDEALAWADRLLRADPLDELALRDAMVAAAALGDRRGAARRFEAFRRRLHDELGMSPEAKTAELHARVTSGGALADRPDAVGDAVGDAAGTTAPAALASLAPRIGQRAAVIGRDGEIADLVERLRDRGARLVTLLGPGGIGKTALAAAALGDLAPIFPDGVFVAPLEDRSGPEAVARSAARAAGVGLRADLPALPQLVAALDGRRALLVLDGFERLLEQATVVDALVRGTVGPSVLVTSRRRLQLSTEAVVETGPLATTTGGAPSPAARLFRRAAARRLTPAAARALDPAAIERIAEQLGGHPLALELAAMSVDVLGLEGLEAELLRSWTPLQSDETDRSPRRRDVRAVIEEAWNRAPPEDRGAWARLALMPGSLDRGVAAEIAGTGWRGLRHLLDRGVLWQRSDRLVLHALLARFGREQAERDASVGDAAWSAALGVWRRAAAREVDARTGRRVWLHPDDLEQALGAWRWGLARGAWDALAEMAIGLFRTLELDRPVLEAGAVAQQAVDALSAARRATGRRGDVGERSARERLRARLLTFAPGDARRRARHAARAWALARRLGDDRALALAVGALLEIAPTERAEERLAIARAAFERSGDRVGLSALLETRGMRLAYIGRTAEAEALLGEAFDLARAMGDLRKTADVHAALAVTAQLRGDHADVRHRLDAAREDGMRVGVRSGTAPMEAWYAIEAEPRPVAAARVAELERLVAELGTGHGVAACLRCAFLARHGTPHQVIRQARVALEACGAPHRVIPMTALLYALRAQAYARLAQLREAAADVAALASAARALDAPRFVARAALAAGELAAARGDDDAARGLAALAWRHPSLEADAWGAARRLLGLPATERPSPAEGRPSDEAMLIEVERSLD